MVLLLLGRELAAACAGAGGSASSGTTDPGPRAEPDAGAASSGRLDAREGVRSLMLRPFAGRPFAGKSDDIRLECDAGTEERRLADEAEEAER